MPCPLSDFSVTMCVSFDVQVNLMQYMKQSTSRDFRINTATLEAALQEQDSSGEVTQSNVVTNNFFRLKCLFFQVVVERTASVCTGGGGSSGGGGDTGAQAEEEETVVVMIYLHIFDVLDVVGSDKAELVPLSYFPFFRDPPVTSMIW